MNEVFLKDTHFLKDQHEEPIWISGCFSKEQKFQSLVRN